MEKDIQKVLVSKDEIDLKIKELGRQVSSDYEGKEPILLGILKGSVPFMGALMENITIPMKMDFLAVSSYHGGITSSGEVKLVKDIDISVEGKHILFVEDIVDTGRTLKYLKELFEHRNAASVKIISLLDKPEGRVVDIKPDYTGFTIPIGFVVGMGLDYKDLYRNLPYVGILKPEIYS